MSPEVPLSTQKQRLLAEVVAFGEDSGPVRAAMRSGRTPECEPGGQEQREISQGVFLVFTKRCRLGVFFLSFWYSGRLTTSRLPHQSRFFTFLDS